MRPLPALAILVAVESVPVCADEAVEREGLWETPPLVLVCRTSPAARAQVERVVAWWVDRGAAIEGVAVSDCLVAPCAPGTIRVDLQDQGHAGLDRVAAATTYHRPGQAAIACARVDLTGPVGDLALAHEIGHALGWGHAPSDGHVMSPTLRDGGWDADGVCPGATRTETAPPRTR